MNEKDQIIEVEKKKEKQKKKFIRKTAFLLLILGVTTTVFIVATYAWFIGITTVNVNTFEIDVSTMPGLEISLDGETFGNEITVSEAALNELGGNNHWTGENGLVPYSSSGRIRSSDGRLDFYSKASITASIGGFKLRTEQIINTESEQDGYITFDLYLKNQTNSDTSGVLSYNHLDEEGVYLLADSQVSMTATGDGGEGIQNGARLGFYQIGRVALGSTKEQVTGITCTTSATSLGLCNIDATATGIGNGRGYTWNVWEPNDSAHTEQSIKHFGRICLKRTGENAYTSGDSCTPISNGTAVTTYAANKVITSANNVNVYDGLNTYMATVGDDNFLKAMEYYTDTQNADSDTKPAIFFLAPNSITKVRVYLWLEGQDVDNFDVGSIGKKLSVSFGFTKDRYELVES